MNHDPKVEGEARRRRFIELFNESGLSQADAAQMCDVTPAAVNHYLSGKFFPSKTVLQLFELKLGRAEAFKYPPPSKVATPSAIYEGAKRLDDSDREMVYRVIARLSNRDQKPSEKGQKPSHNHGLA